ncbi:hypothetical protein Scep_006994 [Stephania cephalantha]|uniref:Uncharacterized protein n=1 Tax=Stephania cephalantha TaxID=152367 RepID=A0AAP0PLC6_9MAGN
MKKFVSTIGKSRAPTNKSDKANVDPYPKSKPSENGNSGDSEITSDCPEPEIADGGNPNDLANQLAFKREIRELMETRTLVKRIISIEC